MFLDALDILSRLAESNPETYEPDVATTLNNLAILYSNTERFTESENAYLEVLEIRRRLAQIDPQTFEPLEATTMDNLASLYRKTQRFTESEAMYLEALEILRRLAQDNPQAYETNLVTTLYNLGVYYKQQGQHIQAISAFEEALPIYRRLAQNSATYGDYYTFTLYHLAKLYPKTEEHAQYYAVNEEWLPILKEWYQEDKENFQEDYVKALGSQSFQCIFMNKFVKAEQYAQEALAIDPSRHWINTNLAASLLFQGRYAEAEAIYRQYKDKLKDSFLQDFNEFEAAGVIPKERKADVKRIRKMLNE